MTDRELLELAAKAVGIEPASYMGRDVGWYVPGRGVGSWNPLTDDGDALRLAIDARVGVEFADDEDDAPIVIAGDCYNQVQECLAPDFKAKTRRAIVRAAAEIGKAML